MSFLIHSFVYSFQRFLESTYPPPECVCIAFLSYSLIQFTVIFWQGEMKRRRRRKLRCFCWGGCCELTELSSLASMALGLLSLLCYPSLRASRGGPPVVPKQNLQLYIYTTSSIPDISRRK
jgi:hypothetical protein